MSIIDLLPLFAVFAGGFAFGLLAASRILRNKISAESWCEGFFARREWEKMRREKDGTFKKP